MAKDEDYRKLIHSKRWVSLRMAKLNACPLCERCKEQGLCVPATEVHHITPVEDAITFRAKEQLMYNPGNLMSLCHDCHVLIHTEMGRSGRKNERRRNDEAVRQAIERYFK